MIAIINNCELFEEFGQELKSRWWKSGHHDNEATAKFETLLNNFMNLKAEAAGFLLDEAFLDIEVHFNTIMTPEWAQPGDRYAIDTVAKTLEDYFEDYNCLRDKNLTMVTKMAQERVGKRYITSLLQPSANLLRKRVNFENAEHRILTAKNVDREAQQLKRFFRSVGGSDFDSPFEAISDLVKVLDCDTDMVSLMIGTLVKKYPDVTHDQLLCLLNMREDLVRFF